MSVCCAVIVSEQVDIHRMPNPITQSEPKLNETENKVIKLLNAKNNILSINPKSRSDQDKKELKVYYNKH